MGEGESGQRLGVLPCPVKDDNRVAQLADLASQEVDVVRLTRSALPHDNAATGHPVRVEAEVPSAACLGDDPSDSYLGGLRGE